MNAWNWHDAVSAAYVQAIIYAVQTVIYAITLVVLVIQLRKLRLQVEMQRQAMDMQRHTVELQRHTMIGTAADEIFTEWWSEEYRKLREYFFLEFVENYLPQVANRSLKEIQSAVREDRGRAARLCFFFDRIGWLGAAGLIDVDYVLGPMQHSMRQVWRAVEPMVRRARQTTHPHFDPVYQYGFEWLIRRSEQPNRHQADLLRRRFSDPSILNDTTAAELKSKIENDEEAFAARIAANIGRTKQ